MIKLIQGDCLEKMADIENGSVDMVLTDPPYGTTACKWDSIIPLEPMWEHLKRVTKPNGAIVMTAVQPFTSALVMSNVNHYKHQWVWNKGVGVNFMHAKRQPLKTAEDVLVFAKKTPRYMPQMVAKAKPQKKSNNNMGESSGYGVDGEDPRYVGRVYTKSYPNVMLNFSSRSKGSRGLHPTQKPVALMEYLIKTYTNEGDTVLDFTMGSGTTGVACVNLNRSFVGIEMDEGYFQIASDRIEELKDN
jgi:site-specific DNA-methyltransferase (adenine-specific)